jgi:hypothetical protein
VPTGVVPKLGTYLHLELLGCLKKSYGSKYPALPMSSCNGKVGHLLLRVETVEIFVWTTVSLCFATVSYSFGKHTAQHWNFAEQGKRLGISVAVKLLGISTKRDFNLH